jgi:hypothetical protein
MLTTGRGNHLGPGLGIANCFATTTTDVLCRFKGS